MALRARELFYFVRMGNYASRPLRQLEGDFKRMGAASDTATARLERMQVQQRRLAARRTQLVEKAMSPAGDIRIAAQRHALMSRDVSLQNRITQMKFQESKINTALFNNETRIMEAKLRETEAQAKLNRMLKGDLATEQQIASARERVAIAGRRVTGAQMTGGDIRNRYAVVGRQVAELNAQLEGLKFEYEKLTQAEIRNEEETRRIITQMRIVGEQAAVLEGEMAGLQRTMATTKWERVGMGARAFTDLSRSVQFASGIVVAGLGFAAHAAANFQTQAAQAATQVGNSFGQMQVATKRIMSGILNQMHRFPASSEEMTKASYDIFSSLNFAGNQAEQTASGMKVLNAANKAAVAGSTDLADATDGIVIMMNTFGKTARNNTSDINGLNKMLNQAFATVRYGKVSFGDLSGAMGTIAPAAISASQSIGSMFGTFAFLTRRMPVRQAAVSYARILELIQRSEVGLVKSGIRVRNAVTKHMLPLQNIIEQIAKKNPGLVHNRKALIAYIKEVTKGTGAGTIGTAQARRGAVFLITQHNQYRALIKDVRESRGQFSKSYAIMKKTAGIRWATFMTGLHATFLEIGATAIPVFEKLLGPLEKAVKWFNNLDKATKEHYTTIVTWVAAATLIISTAGVILGSLAKLVTSFRILAAEGGSARLMLLGAWGAAGLLLAAFIKYPDKVKAVIGALGGLHNVMRFILIGTATLMVLRLAASFRVLAGAEGIAGATGAISGSGGLLAAIRALPPQISIPIIVTGIAIATRPLVTKMMDKVGEKLGIAPPGRKHGRSRLVWQDGQLVWSMSGTPYEKGQKQDPALAHPTTTSTRGRMQRSMGGRYEGSITRSYPDLVRQRATQKAVKHAEAQVKLTKSARQWIKIIVAADRLAAKHPKSIAIQTRAIHLRTAMEKKFTGDQLGGINAVISAYEDADKKKVSSAKKAHKKIVDAQKKANKEALADQKAAIDQMRSMYDDLYQANKEAFGDITAQPLVQNMMDAGLVPKFRDFMGDITSQLKKFTDYRKEIAQGRKVLPKNLLEDIQSKGIEAEPFLAGLLNLTPKQRAQYIRVWKRAQAEIRKATQNDLKAQLNSQLAIWRKHGKNASKAFLAGMKDQQPWINKQLKAIYTDWLKQNPHGTPKKTTDGKKTTRQNTSHTTHNHNNNQVHIHNVKEDLSTSLRKARLHQKQRARRNV